MQEALSRAEQLAKPVLDVGVRAARESLEPLQRAELHLSQAQTLKALLDLLRKCNGHTETDGSFAKEADRLEAYEKKVRKAVSGKLLSDARPTVALDVAAANRFIDHAIPDLTPEQRQALKATGQALQQKKQQEQQQRRARAGGASGQQQAQAQAQLQADAAALLAETLGGGSGS